jgi:hypothetical protein
VKNFLLALLLTLTWVGISEAVVVNATGATADVIYTEPTTNADAALSPLTDLDHCNVYAKPAVGTEIKFPNTPATKLTGGGVVTQNIGVAALPGASTTYAVTVSCSDVTGNESARSVPVNLVVDRLAPSAPK